MKHICDHRIQAMIAQERSLREAVQRSSEEAWRLRELSGAKRAAVSDGIELQLATVLAEVEVTIAAFSIWMPAPMTVTVTPGRPHCSANRQQRRCWTRLHRLTTSRR